MLHSVKAAQTAELHHFPNAPLVLCALPRAPDGLG